MDLGIVLKNDELVVSSLQVAEVFGKEHKRVLRDIRLKLERLESLASNGGKFAPVEVDPKTYFFEDTYIDSKGEERPIYYMTQKGCTKLVMSYSGEKADEYQTAYIEQFEAMKKALNEPQTGEIPIPTPAELIEILRDRLSKASIIIQPKDDEMHQDYFCLGMYGLLRYYGYTKGVPYSYLRDIRPTVIDIGLANFEEILNYCAVKDKLKLAYIRATMENWHPAEVEEFRQPLFGVFGLLSA